MASFLHVTVFWVLFWIFFPFTEKLPEVPSSTSLQPGGSGVQGGAMGVKPTEFILSAVEGFRVPVGPLVLLTVYAITRF